MKPRWAAIWRFFGRYGGVKLAVIGVLGCWLGEIGVLRHRKAVLDEGQAQCSLREHFVPLFGLVSCSVETRYVAWGNSLKSKISQIC